MIGALLTLPGASYLAALDRLAKLDYAPAVTVVIVLCFNVVMLALLEVPIIAFTVAPERTPQAISRLQAWGGAHGRRYAIRGFAAVGCALVIKGVIGLIA